MSSPTGTVLNKTLKKKSLVLEDGKVYKIQKVRQRKILSCIPCHQRKIKCSRGEVCEHCSRNNLSCQYFINDKLSNLNKNEATVGGDHYKKLAKKTTTTGDEEVPSSPLKSDTTLSPLSSSRNTSVSTPLPLKPILLEHDARPETPIASPQQPMITDARSFATFNKIKSIFTDLPTRERSNLLLDIYINTVNPILPIIDIMSFKLKHEEYWDSGLNLISNVELLFLEKQIFNGFDNINELLEFLWVYFAIYYAALMSQFEEQSCPTDTNLLVEYEKYLLNFHKLNDIYLRNLKKLETLSFQVNVLVLSFSHLSSDKSLLEVTKLIKMAQYYQLDHDPVVHQNLNNKSLVQLKRLIWWQIFKLDDIVSGYQFLSSTIKLHEFDTSLPAESSDQLLPNVDSNISSPLSNFCNYALCFLNSKFRYYLLQNELNRLSNGLNASLKDIDINNLKNKINDLYIFCYSSIITLQNTEKFILLEQQLTPYHTQQLKFITYAKFVLNMLADKILIKLQLRILSTPTSVMNQTHQLSSHDKFYSDNFQSDRINRGIYAQQDSYKLKLKFMLLNLNLISNPNLTNYNYNDLSTNLLPCLLHLVNEFINICEHKDAHSEEQLNCFNWEMRNYLPLEELILLTKIIVVNLKNCNVKDLSGNDDIQLKAYLIDRSIELMVIQWFDKLSGINKFLRILHSVWALVKFKYDLDPFQRQYRVPQPSLSPSAAAVTQPLDPLRTRVSCSEIAPRTMRSVSNHGSFLPMMTSPLQPSFFPQSPQTTITTPDFMNGDQQQQLTPKSLSEEIVDNDSAIMLKKLQDDVEFEFQSTSVQDLEDEEGEDEYYKALKNELNDLYRLLLI